MGWEPRDGRGLFYTHYKRVRDRVVRSYYGNDLFGELASTFDLLRKITRLRVAQAGREEQRRHDEFTAPLDRLCRLTDLLLGAALPGAGVNPLDRGKRRRRNQARPPADRAAGQGLPPELGGLVDGATRDDPAALAELDNALEERVGPARVVADLVEDAWQSVLTLAADSSATAREAIGREAEAVRDGLAAKATSGLEKLVIDRLVLSWLVVYHAERELARHLRDPLGPGPNLRAADRRLDQARASSREAGRALAATRLRLKPPLSAREPEVRPAPETTADPSSGPPRPA